jgi:hypothetical protein
VKLVLTFIVLFYVVFSFISDILNISELTTPLMSEWNFTQLFSATVSILIKLLVTGWSSLFIFKHIAFLARTGLHYRFIHLWVLWFMNHEEASCTLNSSVLFT